VVYLGNGWVLTAHHAGAGIVEFGGVRYDPVAGSIVRFEFEEGIESDLIAFRIEPDPEWPDLPILPIRKKPLRLWEDVILIGTGNSRAERVAFEVPGFGWLDGFRWGERRKQWGTNTVHVESVRVRDRQGANHAILTHFNHPSDGLATEHEAQAAQSDSGGALFARVDPLDPSRGWALAGILYATESMGERPEKVSLFGDLTLSLDLTAYRDQIIPVVRPACSNELDDDADGMSDYPLDPGCGSAEDDDEEGSIASEPPWPWLMLCALVLGALVLGALAMRARSRRRLQSGRTGH